MNQGSLKVKLNQININQRITERLASLPNPSDHFYTLDMGNSHPHVGVFEGAQLKEVRALSQQEVVTLKESSHWVSSNVTHQDIPKENRLDHYRQEDSFLGMKVDYATTLGEDRLYQAYFLHQLFPKESFTLIDAGTFITIDHIDQEGFKGGFIFPGLRVFMKSFDHGQKLTGDLALPTDLNIKLPHTTVDAMTEASKAYLLGIIEITAKSQNSTLIFTGGNGELISQKLGSDNFFAHLIHYSLFYIAHLSKTL